MVDTKTIDVPHLGGISVGYKLSEPFNSGNPTLVLVNSFTTSAELYAPWFANSKLVNKVNLLAIELLGHGKTRAHKTEHWTYWDTSIMNLQVMDALKIDKAFVLGTSQGGFIAVRMALLSPGKISGVILLGTCMDREGPEAVKRGCWDGLAIGDSLIQGWNTPVENFEPDDSYCGTVLAMGFGKHATDDVKAKWTKILRETYRGEEGRKLMRMCAINLKDRDGLHARLPDVKCPVLWMQGSDDPVFSIENAKQEIEMFTGVGSKRLIVIDGGGHFLSATNPDEVEAAMVSFMEEHRTSPRL